ncbi:hypothetical protein HELRODRAFT_136695, partial [Helobdella robusta]
LISSSFSVKENSYCQYSKFRVGCSLLCEDGTIFNGTNVENASYGLTICAERSAICTAVSQGHRKFKAIVVSRCDQDKFTYPCGACRQFIAEFGLDIDVYSTRPDGSYERGTICELLPFSFGQSDVI